MVKTKTIWNKILNPKTGRMVNVHGKVGKQILNRYLRVLKGGATKQNGDEEGKAIGRDEGKEIIRNFTKKMENIDGHLTADNIKRDLEYAEKEVLPFFVDKGQQKEFKSAIERFK